MLVSLLTRGSPMQVTGGHLYHRRMAEAAPARGASVEFVQSGLRNPLRVARGIILVDSVAACTVAPWLLARPPDHRPIAAILHQRPGGIGHGAVRTAVQARLDLKLYRRCDVLIAASVALADELVADYGIASRRVCIAEPGCDMPWPSGPASDLRAGRRIALLCVGNWFPNKGVVELLEAVSQLPDDHVTVHLAGRVDVDARYAARVYSTIESRELTNRVVVHGPLSRDVVAGLYASADVFSLPSYVETYGTVFAEAMSAGLPVVGWRSGNLPHLVGDGAPGCLVDPGDVAGLSAALGRLAIDDEWRRAAAETSRRRGALLPTWADTADAFFDSLRCLE